MDLETTAREHSAALSSNRATDRKKGAEALKDLLTRNALPSLLSKNTLKKRGFSWNDLLDDINEYILKETEKYETSKTFFTVTGPLSTSLLHMCIAGANKGQAYLKCDKILVACLFILKNNRLAKAIGDAYLNLLYKYVLPCDHYLGFITPTNWEELLDVSISASLSNYSKLDNYTKLRLVLLILKNGTKYCQLIGPMRDCLPKMKKCFLHVHNEKKLQEVVIEIVTLLIEKISTESRLLMCEFSESIIPILLKYYDHSLEQKKKIVLFRLFEVIVGLHHPDGKLMSEEGSLAHNWETWNKHSNSILEMITLEVAYLQKSRRPIDSYEDDNSHFYSLAAAVYYQSFHLHEDVHNESVASTSSKRQKIALNKYKTLDDLIYQLQLNHMPWLGILNEYVKRYGSAISALNFLSIIKINESVLNGYHQHVEWYAFQKITCLIIQNLTLSKTCKRGDLEENLLSLWNSCVRNSTSTNDIDSHNAIHAIIQMILKSKILKHSNVQPLIKLYLEMGMPVNSNTVNTLNIIINMFFNKCSILERRKSFLYWFFAGNICYVGQSSKELLLRLVANDNINIADESIIPKSDDLTDILFRSMEKSILYSEFELNISSPNLSKQTHFEKSEINVEMNIILPTILEAKISQITEQYKNNKIELIPFSQSIMILINYLDVLIKFKLVPVHEVKEMHLYNVFKNSLDLIFVSLVNTLKSNALIPKKVALLQLAKLMLMNDYAPILSLEIRRAIKEDFFHYANNIMTFEQEFDEDDDEINTSALKYNCIYTLAAYCKIRCNYREEILELILDPKLYKLTSSRDVDCAFRCIGILYNTGNEEPPLDSIFVLMQCLCKDLFRTPDASYSLLTLLHDMLDLFWTHDDEMKQNSFIMIRGYLERCEKLFYPHTLAALIYKCVAKIMLLNSGEVTELDEVFMKAMIKKSKGNNHCMRIYCCYLLENLINRPSFCANTYMTGIADIFNNVPERQEIILKDESMNRTLTLLHSLVSLANAKKPLLRNIVTLILSLQIEKSLDKQIVRKVLNIITSKVDNKTIDVYLNQNILCILHFWFSKKYELSNLPLEFFNIENERDFLQKHMQWLISTDILWRCGGNINDSLILKQTKALLKVPESRVIELCFCNIIALCLPYIVTEKYKVRYAGTENGQSFTQSMFNASRMFQMTREVLENDKWSNLFVENLGELLLITASHLSDHNEAREQFQVDVPDKPDAYQYPKIVFSSILTYFGELTDGDIMQYLCENQPVAIFKILIKLWENVLQENVLELKVLSIHAFKTFVECIPLVAPSNAFICNYVCNCFGYAVKKSHDNKEIKVLTHGLKSILMRFLPQEIEILRKTLSQLMSILKVKQEEGFVKECDDLLDYLVVDMKEYLNEEDVVDFIKSMSSQHSVLPFVCATSDIFADKLKAYMLAFNAPRYCTSFESLQNLHQFLKANKTHINNLCNDLEPIRFSEDCGDSIIHQIMFELNNILKTPVDQKTIIQACNCLAEIGTYDLKTLVTIPPSNTRAIVAGQPRLTFASTVVTSLAEVLFDEAPNVTNKVTKTLNLLLKYKDGEEAIESCGVDKKILTPFLSDQYNDFASFRLNEVKFSAFADVDFLIPGANETHSEWIIKCTIAILDILVSEANYLNALREVCELKPRVCQRILPALAGLLIFFSSEKHITIIRDNINNFFKHFWEMTYDDNVESSAESNTNKKTGAIDQNKKMIIQNMLDVVNFVRLQRNHYTRATRLETLNYLKLDYSKVAWAATVADQNLSAIYYGELWTTAMNDAVPPASPDATTALTGGRDIQRILRKSFVSIGELDAVEGCGTAHLTIEDEKRKHVARAGQHADALLLHDIALCDAADSGGSLQRGLLRALHRSGMHHLALQYIRALPEPDQLNDIKYDCLSVLGDWSDFVDTRDLENDAVPNHNTKSVLKAFRYSCLKDCLNIQMKPELQDKLEQPLNRAKLAVAKLCQQLNLENCQNVYKVLSKLHLFTDIEDYFSVRCEKMPLHELLEKWRVDNLPAFQDFKHLEDVIAQRNVILEHSAKSYGDSLKNVVSLQLQYAELCLNNQRIQMSQRLLAVIKKLQNSEEVTLLESQISWAKGHKDIALSLLRNVVTNPAGAGSRDLHQTAVSLRQYGLWMAESKSDNAREIINKYLKKSLELTRADDLKTKHGVYFDIAKFADAEYKQVVAYMNSSIFENKVKCLENIKETASSLKLTQPSTMTKDERKSLLTNQRFEELEEAEIASTRAEKQTFLHLAMRYYLLSLRESEENNLSVFRVISLWLDNPGIQLDDSGISFEQLLHKIPSHKFIAVLPQLAPRLTNDNTAFDNNLRKILTRCAIDHPHHTLPIFFNLKNSDKDKLILNASQGASRAPPMAQEPRVVAAGDLVKAVATKLPAIVAQMELLCDATISFANFKPKAKDQRQKIPSAELIRKLSRLDAIPIPTDTVTIRSDCNYNFISTLVAFDDYFELVGGINCPKKIYCKDSNGRKKILLIKGQDDLRQDAVMQQVFNIVNNLLEKNTITNKNKLIIRTYKVVPMSRQSGVLEWCEGTLPIATYLVGTTTNEGAHARYRPQDISCGIARQKLAKCHEQRKSNSQKLAVFNSILKEFRPVFHYFFTENYLDPVTWYERRLAYTKSVATSSMVGYILGLGDRHLHNILIDKKTAEVIHIDFGIAFDQGKALPTPETIPFRLTQDIIAGFGCSGVEGIFRRCCEKTLQLLRDNQETLLTILEVLLCDPLYSWRAVTTQQTSIPAPANKDTSVCASGSNSSLAKRALLAVGSKLSGTDAGVAGGVAVPGQVARLISTATDHANLSRLFPGWQPFL